MEMAGKIKYLCPLQKGLAAGKHNSSAYRQKPYVRSLVSGCLLILIKTSMGFSTYPN